MPKRKYFDHSQQPATKKDVEDLAISTEKAFRKMVTKADLAKAEDRIVKRVVHEMQTAREKEIADLEEVHQDQLDIVAGKKDASPAWKSIPRRLKTVEQDVGKIKDQLEIS